MLHILYYSLYYYIYLSKYETHIDLIIQLRRRHGDSVCGPRALFLGQKSFKLPPGGHAVAYAFLERIKKARAAGTHFQYETSMKGFT